MTIQIPSPQKYATEMGNFIFKIYKGLEMDKKVALNVMSFDNSQLAIQEIKNFMDRGAYMFSHFTDNFDKLIIFKSDFTEECLAKIKRK